MRTVLRNTNKDNPTDNNATFVTIKLTQFAKNGYDVHGDFMYPDGIFNKMFTVTPNPYHAKVVYNREIDTLKSKGYVIETEED